MTLTYATICSGIEAVSHAWIPLGMSPAFFSEIEPFAKRFLHHRYPDVADLGDMTRIDGRAWRGAIDVLWGSTPCQAFSLAGKRGGLDDPRGALTPAFVGLADDIAPRFLCWENVDAVLTHKDNPFGIFLAALAGSDDVLVAPGEHWPSAGWVDGPTRRIAWRTLDAKYFGLPQQRRRVFLVACPAGGPDPCSVLFEPRPEGHAAGQRASWWPRLEFDHADCPPAFGVAIRGRKHGQQIEQGGTISYCLRASTGGSDKPMTLFYDTERGRYDVRLLTPVEAERCMGIADDYTLIDGACDGDRYHSIGNSLPVPVVRWLGERILAAA